ncbi:MAG TPA: alpha/beta fold hydrolase [Micromonosporaceae bacterium]
MSGSEVVHTLASERASRRRKAGLVSTLIGAAAAGVAAGVAAERVLLRRRRSGERDPHRDEPFGQLTADEYRTVTTDEGIPLHVEITGDPAAPLTVILVHGFCLDMGTFHFQRLALRGEPGVRVVCYDQPGHGRSGRLNKGEYTLDMIGAALAKVIEQTAPTGRVVLVGHSMGGMAIMALADTSPELFKPDGRVAGVVLISTSAGELSGVSFGLPEVLVKFRKPLLPLISGAGWVSAGMLDRARVASTDLAWLLTRRYGFGSGPVSPALVSYVERMNSATRTESVARYLRAIYTHDRVMALGAFTKIPVLVVCGDEDLLTPLEHSQAICDAIPDAEMIIVPNGGHVALLEYSGAVNAVLLPFIRKLRPARAASPAQRQAEAPGAVPGGQPPGQPTGKPPAQPAGKAPAQPAGKAPGQPAGKPPAQPVGKPPGQPVGKLVVKPAEKPTVGPAEKPTVGPADEPVVKPAESEA